jgi:hypothetical protein
VAKRKQLFHPDDVKAKIQTSQLINRLTEHALSDAPIMDASQVNAAKALIAKTIPDLKAIEHSGDAENPLVHRIERRIIEPNAGPNTGD